MSDIDRIKGNIGRMIDQGAPESDINLYLETEGFKSPKEWRAFANPAPEPSVISRVMQGASDLPAGIKQKFLNITDPAEAEAYTAERNRANEAIEAGRIAHGGGGFDVARMAGSVAANPLTYVPFLRRNVLARSLIGAGLGGAEGGLTYDPTNTVRGAASGAATGAVGGAVGSAVIPPLTQAAVASSQAMRGQIGNWWRSLTSSVSPQVTANISNQVNNTLQKAGIDFAKLSAEVQESILDDAALQLRKTGALNPEQLLRRADIEALGSQPTRAQITRTPADWTAERNLQRIEVNIPAVARGEQETITGRLAGQNTATTEYIERLTKALGGGADGPQTGYQASEAVIKAVQAKDKAAKEAVDNLYTVYRDLGTGGVKVPGTGVQKAVTDVIEEIGETNIPAEVLKRLKEFGFLGGKPVKEFTINEADKLNKLIHAQGVRPGSPEMATTTRIRHAVDDALLDIPEIATTEALKAARAAAAQRFADRRAGLAVERIIGDVAPDRFFQANIVGGNVRDIKALKEQLVQTAEGQQAWDGIRQHVMRWMQEKSTDVSGVVSGARLEKASKELGPEKLKEIFSAEEMAQIGTLLRGSKAMTVSPGFSAVNLSNTMPAAVGAGLRFLNRIPGINMVTAPIESMVDANIRRKGLVKALESSQGALSKGENKEKRDALVKLLMGVPFNPSMVPAAIQQQYMPEEP